MRKIIPVLAAIALCLVLINVLLVKKNQTTAGPDINQSAGDEVTNEFVDKSTKSTDIESLPSSVYDFERKDRRPEFDAAYEVLHKQLQDTPLKTQVSIHALILDYPGKVALDELLEYVYVGVNSINTFKHHNGKPTHVAIYLYTSRERYESDTGDWVAMLTKLGLGAKANRKMRPEDFTPVVEDAEVVKYRLTASSRREVFKAYISAGERADNESHKMYPDFGPGDAGYSQAKGMAQMRNESNAREKLSIKYDSEIMKKYKITEDELEQIWYEGIKARWPEK